MIEDLNIFSKKIQGKIKFNYSLKKHTWLNIGGNSKIFFVPETLIELKDFLLFLKKKILPLLLLGLAQICSYQKIFKIVFSLN